MNLKSLLRLRGERLGIVMIAASLIVIATIIALLFFHQRSVATEDLRARALSQVRLLAGLPYEQLVQDNSGTASQLLRISQENTSSVAYTLVTGQNGEILAEATAPGFLVTSDLVPPNISNWQGERTLTIDGYSQPVIEFYAPISGADGQRANVRIGFFRPSLGPGVDQLPFFATLALIVFMLTPIFYFLLRRELKPVQKANEDLGKLINDTQFNAVSIEPGGELSDFMQRFNRFTDLARQRIESLESEKTGLVTSQKLLAYQQQRAQTILQAIPDAVLILNDVGKIVFANNKAESLLGAAMNDMLEKPVQEWCADPTIIAFLAKYENENSTPLIDDTVRFKPRKASARQLGAKAYPLGSQTDPKQVHGHLVVIRDVSREVMADEARAAFVAHVAHEIKTPLNTLALYSETLQGPDGRQEEFRIEACNVIQDETERLSALVNNLLNITKMETGTLELEKQRIRLGDFLADTHKHATQNSHGKDLQFGITVPRDISPVAIDKELMRIALNNLYSNAVKYCNDGGKVLLAATESDEAIEISITDSGIGIKPEDQKHIFEKFFRSEDETVRSRSGHGLGLPLAKDIIELHGGQLTVLSSPGKGSRFTIRLGKETGLVQQAI